MSSTAIIVFIFVCGLIWGGLIYFLRLAVKFEKLKRGNEEI